MKIQLQARPGEQVWEASFKKEPGPGTLLWMQCSAPTRTEARRQMEQYINKHHQGYRLYTGLSLVKQYSL